MLKLMGQKIFTIYNTKKFCLSQPMENASCCERRVSIVKSNDYINKEVAYPEMSLCWGGGGAYMLSVLRWWFCCWSIVCYCSHGLCVKVLWLVLGLPWRLSWNFSSGMSFEPYVELVGNLRAVWSFRIYKIIMFLISKMSTMGGHLNILQLLSPKL